MSDWIERFVAYTEPTLTPEIFRRWGAISCIAGALERKVWARVMRTNLYPNLYIILVAPPGVGKTMVSRRVREMMLALEEHHLAPSSVTKASLIDAIKEAERTIVRPQQVPAVVSFNALSIVANELGVLLPAYDNEFMNTLTDLYDGIVYSETRRSNKLSIEIKNPFINLIGATTPAYLQNMMPEGAWDQGFASRIILIYNGEKMVGELFSEEETDDVEEKTLKADLKKIGSLFGKVTFTAEAAQHLNTWNMGGCQPQPDHPKLFHYLTRRITHVLKLSIIACISETRGLVVDKEHVLRAIDWLIEAEFFMPDIFRAMSGSTHSQLVDEAWHFVYQAYMKGGKKPVAASRVVNFLQVRTPAHNVMRVIENMEASNIIAPQLVPTGKAYIPGKKEAY